MRFASAILLTSLSLSALACRDGGDSKTPLSAVVPNGSASTPAFARVPHAATAKPETAPAALPAAAKVPDATREANDGEAKDPTETADGTAVEAEKPEPLPNVDVRNVGMHIGGEANTADQKRPIRAAVAKHYDAMKRCYAMAEDPPKGATFGVDMRIKGEGGQPKISNPRSGLRGGDVKACLVKVFENIDFPRQPKGVARMVSFSIAFRRK